MPICSARRFALLLTTVLMLAANTASAGLVQGSQRIERTVTSPAYVVGPDNYGPFEWEIAYDRSFDGTKLTKHVEIEFIFDPLLGWDDLDEAAYKASVEAGIESIWNHKYFVEDVTTGIRYPIYVDVTTTGPFDQTVDLHRGNGRADMTNWYAENTIQINAHEFGHMLGLYDEYIGGAINQVPNPTLSDDGLMGNGALLPHPVMYERYYQQYLDYMYYLNPTENFRLTPIPEPSTWLLLGIGLGCIAVRRRLELRRCA